MRTLRFFTVVVALAALGPACAGGSPSASSPPATTVSAPATGSPTPSPTATPGGPTVQVWFDRGGLLFESTRTIASTPAVGRAAIEALLQGPAAAESTAGVQTAVPGGTALLGLSISKGVATVDLSAAYAGEADASAIHLRLAQVVYTLTQFPSAHAVSFRIEGKPATEFPGGVVLAHPQRRADFARLLPPIVVEQPSIGEGVTSPVTVSGTANVFEGTVSVRILDSGGAVVGRAFTTATCGSGCRGTFSVQVRFQVSGTDVAGTVMVFEASAENGKPINVQRIPVRLNPLPP